MNVFSNQTTLDNVHIFKEFPLCQATQDEALIEHSGDLESTSEFINAEQLCSQIEKKVH